MGKRENDESARIKMNAERRFPGLRLLRNSVGFCRETMVRYGLAVGSADLIGWVPLTVTPDMVGKKLAVFLSVEVKANDKSGRPCKRTEAQEIWQRNVQDAGGIALVLEQGEDVCL